MDSLALSPVVITDVVCAGISFFWVSGFLNCFVSDFNQAEYYLIYSRHNMCLFYFYVKQKKGGVVEKIVKNRDGRPVVRYLLNY